MTRQNNTIPHKFPSMLQTCREPAWLGLAALPSLVFLSWLLETEITPFTTLTTDLSNSVGLDDLLLTA